MIQNAINTWFYIGTIYLFWLTYQDYKNNRMVDDRKNHFMMGFSFAVVMVTRTGFLYILGMILCMIIFQKVLMKVKDIGGADINSLTWILLGAGLFYWGIAFYFALFFTVLSALFIFLKNYIFKYTQPLQFYGVIFLSFVCTGFLFSAY